MASSSKKKRRSSLHSTRIRDINEYQTPSQGLYRLVNTGLSPEEKLEELCRLCSKATIDIVLESGSEDVKDRLDCVKDELYKVFDSEEHKILMKNACRPPEKLLPNPANIELDHTAVQLESEIDRLHREELAWMELQTDLKRQAEEMEAKYSNTVLPESELTDNQRQLSQQYLPENHVERIPQLHDTQMMNIVMTLCEHEETVLIQQEKHREVDEKLNELRSRLLEKTIPTFDRPDTILQRLIDLPCAEEE